MQMGQQQYKKEIMGSSHFCKQKSKRYRKRRLCVCVWGGGVMHSQPQVWLHQKAAP